MCCLLLGRREDQVPQPGAARRVPQDEHRPPAHPPQGEADPGVPHGQPAQPLLTPPCPTSLFRPSSKMLSNFFTLHRGRVFFYIFIVFDKLEDTYIFGHDMPEDSILEIPEDTFQALICHTGFLFDISLAECSSASRHLDLRRADCRLLQQYELHEMKNSDFRSETLHCYSMADKA